MFQAPYETSSEILAGGMEDANELRRRHNQEPHVGWEDADLTNNGRMLLQNSRHASDEHGLHDEVLRDLV